MNKKIIAISILLISIIGMTSTVFKIDTAEAASFNGNYYGYGDSIMIPNGCSGCTPWVVKMQQLYDPTNTSSRNLDGGGQTSTFGKTNFGTHIFGSHWGNMTFEAYGVNDGSLGIGSEVSAQNKLTMFNYSVENSSEDHYWVCIQTTCTTYSLTTQRNYIYATECRMKNYSIPFIRLYDAIDATPYNGLVEAVNTAYLTDSVHPNQNGHNAIAAFAWFFVSGQDKTEIHYSGNQTTYIWCNYTQTIYVDKDAAWDWGDIVVKCTNNGTAIPWTQGVDWDGNPTVHFNGEKTKSYEIYDSDMSEPPIEILSVNQDVNGSTFADTTPMFNWTKINNTLYYWLQISTNSAFTAIVVNLTNINAANYPLYFTDMGTYISFVLPNTYALSSGQKYVRVRAYYLH